MKTRMTYNLPEVVFPRMSQHLGLEQLACVVTFQAVEALPAVVEECRLLDISLVLWVRD